MNSAVPCLGHSEWSGFRNVTQEMADWGQGTPSSVVGRKGWLLSWDGEERDLELCPVQQGTKQGSREVT